jgi:hypothetical protein
MRERLMTADIDQPDDAPVSHGSQHGRRVRRDRRGARLLDERLEARDLGVHAIRRNVREGDGTPSAARELDRKTTGTVIDRCVAFEIFMRTRH